MPHSPFPPFSSIHTRRAPIPTPFTSGDDTHFPPPPYLPTPVAPPSQHAAVRQRRQRVPPPARHKRHRARHPNTIHQQAASRGVEFVARRNLAVRVGLGNRLPQAGRDLGQQVDDAHLAGQLLDLRGAAREEQGRRGRSVSGRVVAARPEGRGQGGAREERKERKRGRVVGLQQCLSSCSIRGGVEQGGAREERKERDSGRVVGVRESEEMRSGCILGAQY
eukprot:351450-Chlamydomonas_euryale.AAC.3